MKVRIGTYLNQTARLPFVVDFQFHAVGIGKSGVGKSSLLKNVLAEHIRQGHGVGLIDPHGDLADSLLDVVPEKEAKRVILFDPIGRRPIGVGMLEGDPELTPDMLAGIIQEVWPDGWGPRTEQLIVGAVITILEDEPHPTILHVHDFFAHEKNRRRVWHASKNAIVQDFGQMLDVRWDKRQREEAIAAPANKVSKFVLSRTLRHTFGQTKALNFREVMDTRKIFVARLPKGQLGSGVAKVIGKVLVYKFLRSALERAAQPIGERVPFLLVIDEAANFADGDVLAEIFAEARKYKLSLLLMVQRLSQFQDPDEVLGSVSTEIAFRTSGRDAKTMEEEFAEEWPKKQFVNLPNRVVLAKTVLDDEIQGPFKVFMDASVEHRPGRDATAEQLRRWSEANWGVDREEVERNISEFLERKADANKLREVSEGSQRIRSSAGGTVRRKGRRKRADRGGGGDAQEEVAGGQEAGPTG